MERKCIKQIPVTISYFIALVAKITLLLVAMGRKVDRSS